MRLNLLTALLATTALATVTANPAEAAMKYGNHSFGGKFAVTAGQNSNAAAAPAKAGKSLDDDEDEDDLGELLEDAEVDDEDLAELDGEVDDDDDDDGIPDLAEPGTPAQVFRDSRFQYNVGLNHGYQINKALSWKSAVSGSINRQMDRHELNRYNWAVNTGPVYNIKSWGLSLNPSVTYLQLNKAHKFQNESTIASLAAKWKLDKQWSFSARANKEFRNNLRPRTTNIDVAAFKFGAAYKATPRDAFVFNIAPKMERNENSLKSKDAWAADIGYARKLIWGVTGGVGYKYSEAEFINGNSPRRDDEQHDYSLTFGKKFDSGMFVNVGTGYKGKKSNIANKGNHDKSVFIQTGWGF